MQKSNANFSWKIYNEALEQYQRKQEAGFNCKQEKEWYLACKRLIDFERDIFVLKVNIEKMLQQTQEIK